MTVDSGPNRFIISPAKFILYFDLVLVSLVITLLSLIPIISGIKVIAIALVAWYGQVKVSSFKVAKYDELKYHADSRKWILNDAKVCMQKQLFLTRNLVMINFYTETGKSLSQVIQCQLTIIFTCEI